MFGMKQLSMTEEKTDPEIMRRELLMMIRRARRYLERFRNAICRDELKDFDKRISDLKHIERKYSNVTDILR